MGRFAGRAYVPGGSGSGGVGGSEVTNIVEKSVTPTVDTEPYATGDSLATAIMEFTDAAATSGGSIKLLSVVLSDAASQISDLELVLFDSTATISTANAEFTLSDADLLKVCGVIPISQGFYTAFADNSVASVNNVNLNIKLVGTSLFGAVVVRGAPDYVAATDVTVALTIQQF